MSELIVAGFPDVLRAAQVVTELHRIDPNWAGELEHAVTVACQDDGRLLVQQTVDPTTGDSTAWSGLWAALIRETLMVPSTEGMPAASRAAHRAVTGDGRDANGAPGTGSLRPSWWTDELGLSGEFIRDVGALVGRGESALYVLLRVMEASRAVHQLRRLGGTVIRCPLDKTQDAKVRSILSGARS